MHRNFDRATRSEALRAGLIACVLFTGVSLAASGKSRLHLAPKFKPGEILRYHVQTHTTSTGEIETPIANPEGGSRFSQKVDLLIRLDVLDLQTSTPASAGVVRLRATYERARSQSETDAFDLEASSLDDRYARLEGRSIELTVQPGGQLADFKGLEDVFSNRSETEPVLSWANGVSAGGGFPPEGITIGQHWRRERNLSGVPLSGLLWRSESTYLRDEPCHTSAGDNRSQTGTVAGQEMCAVILTRFEVLRRGSAGSDATPEEYRRNGLRTSGTWSGSGESLDSISIATGLLVSSTQTGRQAMDYRITSASSGSSIHRSGQVQTQSEITLVAAAPSAAQP